MESPKSRTTTPPVVVQPLDEHYPLLDTATATAAAEQQQQQQEQQAEEHHTTTPYLPSPRLRITRLFTNGERMVDSVELRHLGDLHDRRPGRHIALTWEFSPRNVLVVATPHSRTAMAALPTVIATLQTYPNLTVFVESEATADLALSGSLTLAPVLFAKNKDMNTVTLTPIDTQAIGKHYPPQPSPANDPHNFQPGAECARKRPLVVSRRSSAHESSGVAEEIDLVICLGGDGLILHVVSQLFPRAVPPVMPFNNGSLGFLTPFDVRDHKAAISKVLTGDHNLVTVRMRLQCIIVPKRSKYPFDTECSPSACRSGMNSQINALENFALESPSRANARDVDHYESDKPPLMDSDPGLLEYHVLNEIVIDRGPAPYLSNLEVFADDCPVTRVQADGVIVATPTGSTAYSLSSGGSMVHPSVPAILFTPICPHSLSFRPVLFPRDVVLQIKVPEDARASAWVSLDGRHRKELCRGDKVVIKASQYPVPTFTRRDTTRDWFASVSQCLRWNERVQQTPLYADGDQYAADVISPLTPSHSNEQGL